MRIVAIAAVALLIVAAGSQLYVLQQHQSVSFLHLLLQQPLPQQAAWLIILVAPVLLLFATLWGHERMLQQRRFTQTLSAELRGVREGMKELHTAQKDNEDAVSYLTRGNPESSLDDLRQRLSAVGQPIELHHNRNEAADLLASIEQVREQQKITRERLSRVIAKRASLETAIAELQRFQDEAEQAMARMEEDKHGDTLDTRLRKLIDFSRNAHFRCDEIEGSLQGIAHQEKEFAEVKSRLAPLVDPESGVRKRLRFLQDLRGGLAGSLDEVERDGGILLPDRVKELAESRSGLEQRIADIKLRCEEIEGIGGDDPATKGIRCYPGAPCSSSRRANRCSHPGADPAGHTRRPYWSS